MTTERTVRLSETDSSQLDASDAEGDTPTASTGHLPESSITRSAVEQAYARYRSVREGTVPDYYPALAQMNPDLFGIAVASTSGELFAAGDVDVPFTIMSVAKPFVLALVLEHCGPDVIREQIGVNATGFTFNSAIPIELREDGLTNPMVNAGALATAALVPGETMAEQWENIVKALSRFAGRRLDLDEAVFASASDSNHRNRALANLLFSAGRLARDPVHTVDLYTLQSSLAITVRDLAVMGGTLADGGVNPRTGERVVSAATCRRVLAVMATAGLYETSGDWLYEVGLPGKSGVGGGIVTVSPGKGSLATFAPPLDAAGNSVRGQLVARFLAQRLGLDLFTSSPDPAHHLHRTIRN